MGTNGTGIVLVVEGEPVAKARPRFTRSGQVYTPAKTKQQEELIRSRFLESGAEALQGAIEAEFEFIYEPPKSWSKTKRLAMIGMPKTTKPDTDNLVKLCQDALNNAAYTDDSRIFKMIISKVYGTEAKTIIRLKEVENIG